jgi:hypothetical protein
VPVKPTHRPPYRVVRSGQIEIRQHRNTVTGAMRSGKDSINPQLSTGRADEEWLLKAVTAQFVDGDQALVLGRELPALHRMPEQ